MIGGLVALGLLAGTAGTAQGRSVTVSFGPSGDGVTNLSRAFDVVADELDPAENPPPLEISLPVDLAGFDGLSSIENAELVVDRGALTLTVRTTIVGSEFGATSPLAALPEVGLLFTAVWSDASDLIPDVALGFQVADLWLADLNPAFTAVDGFVPKLPDVTLVLSTGTFTIDDPFYGGSIDVGPGVNLDGDLDIPAGPMADAMSFLGAALDGADDVRPIAGTLAESAHLLFDGNLSLTDPNLGGLSLTLDPGVLSNGPSFIVDRVAAFEFSLVDADGDSSTAPVASIALTDEFTTGVGLPAGVNTFERTVALSTAKEFSASISSVGTFTTPFGLDWLTLSDVDLDLALAEGSFSASLAATVVLPDPPNPRVTIEFGTSGGTTSASLTIDGPVELADIVAEVTNDPDLDSDALDGISLETISFSYEGRADGRRISFGAEAKVGALDAEVLLALDQPTTGADSLLLGLRIADPLCGSDADPCIRLGNLFPALDAVDCEDPTNCVEVESTPAADIELPALDLLVVQGLPEIEIGDVPTGKVDLDPSAFGAAAEGFFTPPEGELPSNVELDLGVALSGDLELDKLGPEVRNALGYAEGSVVKVTGKVGATLNVFDPALDLNEFSLEVELPALSPALPDWLAPPVDGASVAPSFTIAYVAGNGTDPATYQVAVAFDIEVSDDLGLPDGRVTAEFSKSGDDFSIAFSAEFGEWVAPFGVEWLTLDSVVLEVSFTTVTVDETTTTTLAASLSSQFQISGETFALTVSGQLGDSPKFSLEAQHLGTVTLGDLAKGILPADLDSVVAVVPHQITGVAANDPKIVITASKPGGSFVASVAATANLSVPLREDDPDTTDDESLMVAADVLVSLDTTKAFALGLRPTEELTLKDIVPASPIDFPLITVPGDESSGSPPPTFGLFFTNKPITTPSDQLDSATRDFLAPLHLPSSTGEFTVNLPEGLGALGAVTLPDDIASFVGDALALKPGAQIGGTLPLFEKPLGLQLGLELDAERLPEWMNGAGLQLELAVDPAKASVEVALAGWIEVRVKSGMDPDVVETLGLEVRKADPVAADFPCANGTVPQPVEEVPDENQPTVTVINHYCFDNLRFTVRAALALSPTKIEVSLGGSVDAVGDGAEWNPFGIEWIGVERLAVELGLIYNIVPQTATVTIGFAGDGRLGDKDLLFAAKIGVTALPYPPFALPSFKGIRMASSAGVELHDIVDIVNAFKTSAAEAATIATGESVEPELIDKASVPNPAIKNFEFGLALEADAFLCITGGFAFSGDLYMNPPPGLAGAEPKCAEDGSGDTDDTGLDCLSNADNGCVAGIDISVSLDGIFANVQLAPLEIGPLRFGFAGDPRVGPAGTELDIAVSLGDTHVRIAGGAAIVLGGASNETVIAGGNLAVELRPFGFDFYGDMEIYGMRALIEGGASLELLKDPANAGLRLHLLAEADPTAPTPNFNSVISAAAEPIFDGVRKTFLVADGILIDAASLDFAVIVQNLPTRLRQADIEVPTWADDLSVAFNLALQDVNTDVVADVVDVTLNGFVYEGEEKGYTRYCQQSRTNPLPGIVRGGTCWARPPVVTRWYTIPGKLGYWSQRCFFGTEQDGKCWKLFKTPFTIGGVCDTLFPHDAYPNLRLTENGPCLPDRLVDEVIIPLFDQAIQQLAPGTPSIEQLRQDLRDKLLGAQTLFEFRCFDFDLELTTSGQSVFLGFEAIVYDAPISFRVGWDAGVEPVENLDALVQGVFGSFTGDPVEVCPTDQTGGGTPPPPPPTDGAQIGGELTAATVPEGTPITFDGTFDEATADTRSITIRWGDGTTSTVETPTGAVQFESDHVYADDDDVPGTTSRVATVSVSDPGSPVSPITRSVTVTNVAPEVSATATAVVDENGIVTLSGTFTDPGADSHRLEIDWKDGTSVQTVDLPFGDRAFSVDHRYHDDRPSGTASDVLAVEVTVIDDDGGIGNDSVDVTVRNVAPAGVVFDRTPDPETGLTVFEGTPMLFSIAFDDPGSEDSHTITIDWGDGTASEDLEVPAGERVVEGVHVYDDDVPSGTESDEYIVMITVTDDDLGSIVASFPLTVVNVEPFAVEVLLESAELLEGGEVGVVVLFEDPGTDEHVVSVDWGDGSEATTVQLSSGERDTVVSHAYADDDPSGTASDPYDITVTIADDDTGENVGFDTLVFDPLSQDAFPYVPTEPVITVANVDPTVEVDLTPVIDEDGVATLTVDFEDPGLVDSHTIEIDWGDGTMETLAPALVVGDRTATAIHRYLDDDPTATTSDVYTVKATVTDDDTGSGFAQATITVDNIAPAWSGGTAASGLTLGGTDDASDDTVDENGVVTLTGSFDDPGTFDVHDVVVDWGDGTSDTLTLPVGDRTFETTHRYLDDDPTGTSSDAYTISVTITDDDTGTDSTSIDLTVDNVAPAWAGGTAESGLTLAGSADVSDDRVDEDGVVTLAGSLDDPGTLDVHEVVVDWGDGTSETFTLPVGDRTFETTHRYLDDDPTGTPSDSYTINVTVTDDDTGTDTTSIGLTVNDVAPVVGIDATTQTVQYSDPIADVTVGATDVAGDPLTAATSWGAGADTSTPGLPPWLTLSADGDCSIDAAGNSRSCSWTLSAVPDPVSGVHTDIAPGTYSVRVRVTDDDTLHSDVITEIVVGAEDAVPAYVGPTFAATASASDGTAEIMLRANLRDITTGVDSADPRWDGTAGDIGHATVTFVDSNTGAELCTAVVTYLFTGDTNIGTAECAHTFDIGNDDAVPFEITVRVDGRYTNDAFPTETVVVVAKPLDDFITGGGYVVLAESAGVYAGDVGSHANFGFNVKFQVNKNKVNLKGRVTLIIRQGDRIYKIKSTAIQSAGIDHSGAEPSAQFEAKANLTDVTDPDNPISLGGNLQLQMMLAEGGDNGDDSIMFTLYDAEQLLFSSRFTGLVTELQALDGGNLQIHD